MQAAQQIMNQIIVNTVCKHTEMETKSVCISFGIVVTCMHRDIAGTDGHVFIFARVRSQGVA